MKAKISFLFNTEKDRKELAETIASVLGATAEYMKAPTYGYSAGGWEAIKDDDGVQVSSPLIEATEVASIAPVLECLKEAGHLPGEYMSVEVPLEDATGPIADRMCAIVEGKASLIQKAFQTDRPARVFTTKNGVELDFFKGTYDNAWLEAALLFSTKVQEKAEKAKRVTAKDKEVPNEKYAFRVFLLALGFIGEETKKARNLLLGNMSGNGSWKQGKPKKDEAEPGAPETTSRDEGQDCPYVGNEPASEEMVEGLPSEADEGDPAPEQSAQDGADDMEAESNDDSH